MTDDREQRANELDKTTTQDHALAVAVAALWVATR